MGARQKEREPVVPLEHRPQRLHRQKWWNDRSLLGDGLYDTPTGEPLSAFEMDLDRYPDGRWVETYDHELSPYEIGPARRRYLPEDTYLHPQEVMATLTAALYWDKAISVSFMRMEMDPLRGVAVPMQHHHNQAVLAFIEKEIGLFGIISPDSEDQQSIDMALVTDISLHELCQRCRRQTRHVQNDGSTAVVTWDIEPESIGDEDWVEIKDRVVTRLDDGTAVPTFVNERGDTWAPVFIESTPEQVQQQTFDQLSGLNDYLRYGTADEVRLIDSLKQAGDDRWRDLAESIVLRGRADEDIARAKGVLWQGLQVDG